LKDFFSFHKYDYFVPGKVEENGKNDEVKRNPLQILVLKIQARIETHSRNENFNESAGGGGKFALG
jgi:hypothetical protein